MELVQEAAELSCNFRLQPANTGSLARAEHCLGVFGDLLRRLEILVVDPALFILAGVGRVFATNVGTRLIDPAHLVVAQMFALRVDQQIPGIVIDEDRRTIVEQIPADVLEVLPFLGRIDRKSEIPTAFRRTIHAQIFVGFQVFARGL
jgi:hypothetical protein